MIRGNIKLELSVDTILSKISAYDIYRFYFGDFKINEVTYNHLRGEKGGTPSFVIGNKGKHGELRHMDFSSSSWRGDCFDLVRSIYNCSLWEACVKIDQDFGLGIHSTPLRDYKKIVSKYSQPEELGKRYSLIQVVTRKFTKEELAYWEEYHITPEELKSNHIYSIKELYINKSRYALSNDVLRFGYLICGGYWKIYFPHESKKRKWLSNVPLTTIYGLENIDKDHNTLIVDSLKDMIVCKKIYNHVIQVQNESLSCISKEDAEYITANSKEVFVGFDADEAGKLASRLVTGTYGWKHINPPDYLLQECCKDWADWAKHKGIQEIHKHFLEKGL